ncbi:MAG: DEAD/DEAH box helicase [Acholeplasmataceae bacterium]
MKIETILKNLNFNELTPIQKETIKNFNKSENIVGLAPTGTGKTHAYLIPILLNTSTDSLLETIIIVPTNELVIQVSKMLLDTKTEITSRAIYGDMDLKKEANRFKNNPPKILITTPQKLIDLTFKYNVINLNQIKYFVLDEADMLFDDSFIKLIDPFVEKLSNSKFLLYSASLNEIMNPFIKKYFGSFINIDTTKESILDIDYYLVENHLNKLETLDNLLTNLNPFLGLIFVSKNEDINLVYEYLLNHNYNVISYSSKHNLKTRRRLLNDIHNLKYQYIVTSDLLARGIDFESSHIINYDLPYKLEYFTHRSGRTGRMGKKGEVYLIYENNDSRKIDKLIDMGIDFTKVTITKNGIKKVIKRKYKYDKQIAAAIKSVPKPTKVKPGYKKKHQKLVKEEIKKIRKKRYRNASLRKPR